ncbi:McrC family protein [Robinsoniella peoriensis]|uniref:McrC family protein n=1 Tax=Robinsoniella peoriensis TaxID=180332 RepID=UPI0037537192
MINGYEFSSIKTRKLPHSWQEEGALAELEKFLQSNWVQRSIFYSDGYVTSRQQFIDFDRRDGIKLKNYIGTIIFKGEQLNVFPKIFKEDEDDNDTESLYIDDLINNLVIWLGYCDKLNFPFVSMKGKLSEMESLLELFITIYIHYVKAALDRQGYFQYEDITETGSFIKGKVDFKDYATRKYPMGMSNKLDYTYSSFEFDNSVNRIIKSTCNILNVLTKQRANKDILRRLLMRLGDVSTVSCVPSDCDKIHLSTLHSNYRIILSMSKMFLLNKVNTYNMGRTEAFCFLFPAEILFEEFVGGFIKDMFRDTANVSTQTRDQHLAELVVDGEMLGKAFQLREDMLIEMDDKVVVLDTKYKEIDRFEKIKDNRKLGISDSDIKQMAIYGVKRGAKKLYLLFPLYRNEPPEVINITYNLILEESNSKIPLQVLKIPFVFARDVEETKAIIKSILAVIET